MKFLSNAVLTLALVCFSLIGHAQFVLMSSSHSNNLTACLNETTYQITINNVSPYNLSNIVGQLQLPDGVQYVPSTIAGGSELNITNNASLQFSLNDINRQTVATISFVLRAGCMDVYSANQNLFSISFDGVNLVNGTIQATQTHQSALYTIGAPNLSLTTMTNQSFSGNIGDQFTRCITITNGGNGPLASFQLEHEHGSGLVVSGISHGTSVAQANGTLHTFSAADFMLFGNGNGVLDPGESITFCEQLQISACAEAQSLYSYSWGCNDEKCQELVEAANVVFASEAPNLVLTPWTSFTSNTSNGLGTNCYGNNANGDFPSSLTITNTGTGDAINTVVDIAGSYSSHTGWVIADYFSSINVSSLTVEINGGAPTMITPTSTIPGNAKPCLPANPINGVSLTIPLIEPGDVVVIRWNHYTCCNDNCENSNRRHLLHWRYRGGYENVCGMDYVIPQSNALPQTNGSFYHRNQLSPDVVPGTMTNGEVSTVTFMAVNSEFNLPRNSSDQYKYRVVLPDACLTINTSSLVVRNQNGVVVNVAPVVTTNGNEVEFEFPSIQMGTQWTITFSVEVNCASCVVQGVKTLQFQTLYRASSTCDCWLLMGCTNANIDVLCPPVCNGTNLISNKLTRVNFGLADNDNNGIPDAGPMNMANVRRDRIMHGDTLRVTNESFVVNDQNENLRTVILTQIMTTHGQRMTYINSSVRIYRAATNSYHTANGLNLQVNVTTVGSTRTWRHGFLLNGIAALGLPANSRLQSGDSVIVESYYVNSVNNNANYLDVVNVISTLQASTSANISGATTTTMRGCNELEKEFTMIGWYHTTSGENTIALDECDQGVLTQNFYLSIGPCCNNYNGGNLFPFEYRNWTFPANMFVELPDEYSFVDARFRFVATGGTLVSRPDNANWYPLTPISVNALVYEFDLTPYFGAQGSGNQILFSDDGYHGTIEVRIEPTCNVENGQRNTRYRWTYNTLPSMLASGLHNTGWISTDPVTYQGPVVTMQSNSLQVNTQTGVEQWDLTFQNSSFISQATNFWLAAPTTSGLTADSLINLSTNSVYYPIANGVFALPNLPAASTMMYRLFTTMSSCQPATMTIYSGWGCSGTPITVDDYECEPLQLNLTVNPLSPSFESSISLLNNGISELCNELDFEITIRNFQLGYGFNMQTDVQLPYGLQLVSGSAELLYVGTITSLADPVLQTGITYRWDLSQQTVLQNGLIGIVDSLNNSFKIRFKAIPVCGFSSGERVFTRGLGQSFCGSNHQSELTYTAPIILNNMSAPYQTSIGIGIDFITPCGPSNNTVLTILNEGPGNFGNADTINFVLPAGLTYATNSFVGIHNAAINQTEPLIVNSGSQIILKWPLQAGVVANDSMSFLINLAPDPSQLPCEITELRAFTNVLLTAQCATDGNICSAGMVTGEEQKFIYTYKTIVSPSNTIGNVHLQADGTELLSGSFDLTNQGASLSANYNIVYQIVQDVNGDNQYNAMDTVVHQATVAVQILEGTTQTIQFSNVPVADFCGGTIRLLLADNACFCSDNIFPLNVTLSATNFVDSVCSLDGIPLSYPDVNGHTYTWNPANFLSSGVIAQPQFSAINNTNAPVTYTYLRTVQKQYCAHVDTSVVVVNPLPLAILGSDDIRVCQLSDDLQVQIITSNSQSLYTVNYEIDGQAASITSIDTAYVSFPTSSVGTSTIQLTSITDASTTTCGRALNEQATIEIAPLPQATISDGAVVCMNTSNVNLILTGSNASNEYTFNYMLNGDSLSAITSNGSISIAVPTNVVGTLTYHFLSIQEGSANSCEVALNEVRTFEILPLPQATIATDTTLCAYGNAYTSSIVGANSTAPYTFNYTINGNNFSGIGNAALDIMQTTTTPGTYTYELIDVIDANLCTSTLNQTQIITVLPLPQVAISGDTTACLNSPGITLNFEAVGATTDFSIYYSVSGLSMVSESQGGVLQIPIPTDEAGSQNYNVLYVEDVSISACQSDINEAHTFTILPLPTATLDGGGVVCQNSPDVSLTLIGGNSSAPYTFTYSVNGQQQTAIGSPDFSFTLPTQIAGQYPVHLTQVSDGSIRNCSTSLDTIVMVRVNPLPQVSISGSTVVCQNADAPSITFSANGATGPYLIHYTLNGNLDSIVVSGDSISLSVPTAVVGTYNFELVSVQESSVVACVNLVSGNAQIVVNDLPLATISGDTAICQNSGDVNVSFQGSNTMGPYSFYYVINGQTDTLVVNGNSVLVNQTSSAAGTYTYQLVGVQDASPEACYRPLDEEVVITINAQPYASIHGSDTICLNDEGAIIQFTGEMGVPGYTFHYTIVETTFASTTNSNGQLSTQIQSVNAPQGVFTYVLTGVTESSSTSCYTALNDTVVIVVHDLPNAIIVGYAPLCQDDPNPFVQFVADNGLQPYTFVYSINGQQFTTQTMNGTSIATIEQQTDEAGIFDYQLISVTESQFGCSNEVNLTFSGEVYPRPIANFSYSPQKLMTSQNTLMFENTSEMANSYWWSFGDGSTTQTTHPIHQFETESVPSYLITLIATSDMGCIDTVAYTIKVHKELLYYVPNTFTPNSNGVNELFQPIISYANLVNYYEMKIYNRWGQVIYSSTDVYEGWDGTFRGEPVQDGTYTYVIYVREGDSVEIININGHLNVVR